jgi:hypothetical protein
MSNVDSLIITNAEDLNSTDFACMVSQSSLTIELLDFKYDKDEKTLSIKNFD